MSALTFDTFRKELATKADLAALKTEIKQDMVNLKEHLADTKHEILKWMMGIVVAESALIVAVIGVGLAVLGR